MFLTWSLLGVEKAWATPRSPLGVLNSKFPTSIPTPFICGVPPSGGGTWFVSL